MLNRAKKKKQPETAATEFEILVEKASQGERQALCGLCEEIARGVLFQLTHMLGNKSNAEDVSQEVLVRVCENIQSLRNPKAFKSWLSRIIINEKNRYLAKSSKKGIVLNIEDYVESILEDKENFLPQEFAENEELHETVMKIVSGLPARQREAVMLHYYSELSVTEVAEAMGITTQSVSKSLALAREKLKNELREQPFAAEYINMMGALPIGTLLMSVLQREGMGFVAGEAYAMLALATYSEYAIANTIAAEVIAATAATEAAVATVAAEAVAVTAAATTAAPAASAASGASFGAVMCACAAALAASAIVLGVSLSGELPSGTLENVNINFNGGISHGENLARVNPEDAHISLYDANMAATVMYWWIAAANEETVLHQGYGDTVSGITDFMQLSGYHGAHVLFFRVQDEVGTTYRIGSNFYILEELNE